MFVYIGDINKNIVKLAQTQYSHAILQNTSELRASDVWLSIVESPLGLWKESPYPKTKCFCRSV